MDTPHSLLRRQLKLYFGGGDIPQELQDFINAVNTAYCEFDSDREMLERSLELSSQEMLRTNAEMRAVFHAIPDMLFVIDENGTILDHKARSAEDVYPSPKRSVVGKRIQDVPVREVGEKFAEALARVRQEKAIVSIEYALPMQGVLSYYEARLAPAIENQFIAIVRNVTEQKLAADDLRRERDFTSTLVESSPAFFIAISTDGKIIMMNKAMLTSLGYTPDEVRGREYLSMIVPPPNQPLVARTLHKMVGGAKPLTAESSVLTKLGRELLVEWHVRPVFKDDGEVDFVFAVGMDITGRKHLEAQLQQAHKMEAVGTLAAGVAHDFNNLLMGIQGRTSLMLMGATPGQPCCEHLSEIEKYVQSAMGLTRQLLGFARGGKYEVKPTDLNALIARNAGMFGRTQKGLRIRTLYEDGLWTVEVDQGQIDQVLLNLYVNAVQAMPAGGDLVIQTRNTLLDESLAAPYGVKPGKYVMVSVTDTGVGMDKDTQQRVFDPFFTTKGMGRGSGLGLASAYGIIKHHDGTINVASEKGKGTTVTIYLPVSEKEVRTEIKPEGDLLKGAEVILIVDDEEIILDVSRQMLEALGYTVVTATGGKQALEIYQRDHAKIAMIILDMVMPEIGGSETFNALREKHPDVKVLLASGYSLDGKAQKILNRGCNGFIQKPFTIRRLSQKLREILDEKHEQGCLDSEHLTCPQH
jgi:two-component system cell cycle sensor histidine kinase/response regulator CckA